MRGELEREREKGRWGEGGGGRSDRANNPTSGAGDCFKWSRVLGQVIGNVEIRSSWVTPFLLPRNAQRRKHEGNDRLTALAAPDSRSSRMCGPRTAA